MFFVVRENRTYDQVLGDVSRGDGDPALTLFGRNVTPDMHALVSRFPLLDHVYANSEASIDGHFWTSAAAVSDYVQRNWEQNYAGRNRPYDFGAYTITWPGTGFLFDRAQRQGISYENYGEVIAGTIPPTVLKIVGVTDKDIGPAQANLESQKFAHSKIGYPFDCYPNDTSIGTDAIAASLTHGQRETFDSTVPAGRRIERRVAVRLLQAGASAAARRRQRPRLQLPGHAERPHHRGLARHAHAARDGGRERLRPRPARGPHLPLEDLELVGDLHPRGRLAGRRRPRRRAPDAGRRVQPLRPARSGRPHALRHALDDPLDGVDPRHEAARSFPTRSRRRCTTHSSPRRPTRALQRGRAHLSAAAAQPQHTPSTARSAGAGTSSTPTRSRRTCSIGSSGTRCTGSTPRPHPRAPARFTASERRGLAPPPLRYAAAVDCASCCERFLATCTAAVSVSRS